MITSRQNPRFQQWLRWARKPQESECPFVPVEGWKQVLDAARAGRAGTVVYSGDEDGRVGELERLGAEPAKVSERLMGVLSGVKTTQGVVAFVEKPRWELGQLGEFVLVLDGLQDPGNLGTLLRTAAAAGVSLATTEGSVSCFNPKVVRASSAALFSVPFVPGAELEDLRRRGYDLWAAEAGRGESLFDAEFESPLAVVIGGEGRGPSEEALQTVSKRVHIPMRGKEESLNAAVAGALVVYEWVRRGRASRGAGARRRGQRA